jgi:hypothetical protein
MAPTIQAGKRTTPRTSVTHFPFGAVIFPKTTSRRIPARVPMSIRATVRREHLLREANESSLDPDEAVAGQGRDRRLVQLSKLLRLG